MLVYILFLLLLRQNPLSFCFRNHWSVRGFSPAASLNDEMSFTSSETGILPLKHDASELVSPGKKRQDLSSGSGLDIWRKCHPDTFLVGCYRHVQRGRRPRTPWRDHICGLGKPQYPPGRAQTSRKEKKDTTFSCFGNFNLYFFYLFLEFVAFFVASFSSPHTSFSMEFSYTEIDTELIIAELNNSHT